MPTTNKARVFVVDDEAVIAWSLSLILNEHGFSAEGFTDPVEALRRAKLEPPNLLISDVKMPVMSGIELAVELQKACPECKVLLFSGQATTLDLLAEAHGKGYEFEVLQKPVHPKDLLRRLLSGEADDPMD